MEQDKLNKHLHWTTTITEKVMLGGIGILTVVAALLEVWGMWNIRRIELADLFLLFIYTEIVGMVGAYYISNRIPVTLPIIIAMTALCRLIILHSKDGEPLTLLAEAGAIVLLAGAAYAMSAKEKLSLQKKAMKEKNNEGGNDEGHGVPRGRARQETRHAQLRGPQGLPGTRGGLSGVRRGPPETAGRTNPVPHGGHAVVLHGGVDV